MLSQENRLRKRSDFDRLFKAGKSVGSRNLVFKYAKSPFPDEPSRIAFIVSNKTEKSAVKRNRVKRQLRAAVRELLPYLVQGYDGAFIVKPGLLPVDYQKKLAEVKQLLKKAGMLH